MRRRWFQTEDGTYYRNFNVVEQELGLFWNRVLPWRHRALMGDVRKDFYTADQIGRRDVVVQPLSFREAYPTDPRMWVFDPS